VGTVYNKIIHNYLIHKLPCER